jgi:hypothetical protein
MQRIVVTGNLINGFSFYGPFGSSPEAVEWASENLKGEEWWIAFLSGFIDEHSIHLANNPSNKE